MKSESGNINLHDGKAGAIPPASMISSPTILTGMSHEVRTHMNAIVAFSYLMNRVPESDGEREEFSNQILASCEQLIGLLDNFLDSAIIESGSQRADYRKCRLSIIFAELLTEFRDMLKREACQDIALVSENSTAGSDEVYIDADRVFRVIRILFQNAMLNTKTGYIKIGYNFRDGNIIFFVIDSGQGYLKCKEFLQSEDLDESLAKFNDTTSAINITLANRLIRILGGSVWIECNGPGGTGFFFSIPEKQTENQDQNIKKHVNSMIPVSLRE